MTGDIQSDGAARYPKREKSHFAHKAVRLMHKTCLAQQVGADGVMLLTVIAHTEDAKRYTGPVTFFNEPLMNICGFNQWKRLDRVRKAAIDAGWLHYEAPKRTRRTPGVYWITIPEDVAGLDDSPLDEGDDESQITYRRGYERGYETGYREGYERGADGAMVEPSNGSSKEVETDDQQGEPSTLALSLVPNPDPVPKPNPTVATATGKFRSFIDDVVAHYLTFHPRAKPGKKERDKIRDRLREEYSADDLKLAIDGCHRSPFHCGENESGQKHQSLELIMRDSAHVAKFLELAEKPNGQPVLSGKSMRTLRAGQSFLERFEDHEI